MNWIETLVFGTGVAHSILLVAMVIAAGLYLNRIKICGISLGVTWILFVGIFAGHLGLVLDDTTSHFVKEFGLILFVYSIGIQVGPGFFESFRSGGVTLNMLAALLVILSCVTCYVIHVVTGENMFAMIGVLYGAVTNTPGLGAAQQTFSDMSNGASNLDFARGYAVAYPLAVVGIIGSIVLFRYIFGVKVAQTDANSEKNKNQTNENLFALTFLVSNDGICGQPIRKLHQICGEKIVITRIMHAHNNEIELVDDDTVIGKGDKIFIVLPPEEVSTMETLIGKVVEGMKTEEWDQIDRNTLVCERLVLTNRELNGTLLGKLALRKKYNVQISRIKRAGVDLMPRADLVLQMGDRLTVVGQAPNVKKMQELIGDHVKKLDEPNLMAIFMGVALGVLFGSIPIFLPGMSVPVKLGLAGGPLIVSILVSKFGTKFKLVTYTTSSANLMMRQIGITMFLASVGIGAGNGFIDTVLNGGYWWVLYGFIITVLPIMIVGVLAGKVFKIGYFSIAGMVSGALTDPPALAYGNSICPDDQVSVGYSTVYPLSMFLRVISAQILVLAAF